MPTFIAAMISFAGVGVLAIGTVGSGHLIGDLLAVAMMLLNAVYAVLIRMLRESDVMLSGAVASLQVFVVGLFFAQTAALSWGTLVFILLFGVSFGLASILWTEGAKLIPASEVGVLSSADIPFAIIFAWIFVGEWPPTTSLLGALIVLAAVVFYTQSAAKMK